MGSTYFLIVGAQNVGIFGNIKKYGGDNMKDQEIIRWLKDGSRLILIPSKKKILYNCKIINKKGKTRCGYKNVIEVGANIDPLNEVKKINGCI